MKKILGVMGVAAFLFTASAVSNGEAAGQVTPAADNCMNAHAILMASTTGNHAFYWEAIGNVMRVHPHWTKVQDYTPGKSQEMSFRQYDTKFHQGGTAYVAHCGHGATCNELARETLRAYPDTPNAVVFCGEVPHILDNPQSAGL